MKCFIVMVAVLAVVSYRYIYNEHIPAHLQSNIPFRLHIALLTFINDLCQIGSFFGCGENLILFRKFLDALASSSTAPGIRTTDDVFNGVPVRIYTPEGAGPNGRGMVYYHGGGWTLLGVDSHHLSVSTLAEMTRITTVSVGYRLAPEHPFPIPLEDCVAATKHFLAHAAEYGVDPTRIIVAGDSAGGNLAAAVSLKLRDDKLFPPPKAQVLIYPCLQPFDMQTPSYQAFGDGLLLSTELMVKFWLYYAQGHLKHYATMMANNHTSSAMKISVASFYADHNLIPEHMVHSGYVKPSVNYGDKEVWQELKDIFMNPYFAPLATKDYKSLPSAYIFTTDADLLRDDGIMYAKRLEQAGVLVHLSHSSTNFHGSFVMYGTFTIPDVEEVMREINNFVNSYV